MATTPKPKPKSTHLGVITAQITRRRPPVRRAHYPASGETDVYGVPSFQADFYGMPAEGEHQEHASTFEHLMGALAACLTGTLGQALTARGVASDGDNLTATAEGDVESDDQGVMVLARVRVHYRIRATEDQRAAVERAHEHHIPACGVARSIMPSLPVTSTMEIVG
jgi:uncharacterized OsmC-like protein